MKYAYYHLPDYYAIMKLHEGATQEEIDAKYEERSKRIYENEAEFNDAYELLRTEEGREWYRSRVEFQSSFKPLQSEQEVLGKSDLIGKAIWFVLLVAMLYLMAGFIPHHFFFDSFIFYILDMVFCTALACFVATKLIKVRDKHFEPKLEEIRQHNLAIEYENEQLYRKHFGEGWSEYRERAYIK